MPVDRAVDFEIVGDIEADILSFGQTDKRARHAAIDCNARPAPSLHDAMAAANRKVNYLARNFVKSCGNERPTACMTAAMHVMSLCPCGHCKHRSPNAKTVQNRTPRELIRHTIAYPSQY